MLRSSVGSSIRFLVLVGSWFLLQAPGLGPAPSAAGEVAVGAQFQVSSYTSEYQVLPTVAVGPDGGFVVVWESYGSPGDDDDGTSVLARRYASDGTPSSGELQVNDLTAGYQDTPRVASHSDGGFLVVWASDSSPQDDNDGSSVLLRRFDSSGAAIGASIQINSYTTSDQFDADVAIAADGSFVVAWAGYGSSGTDSDYSSVHARRFSSSGAALGGELQVNTYTTQYAVFPRVGVAADGAFAVVWWGRSDGGFSSINGQRFASDGAFLGAELVVNTYTTSQQSEPAIGMADDGRFVVVWSSNGSAGDDVDNRSVQLQRFASDGGRVGAEFQVNVLTTDFQFHPSVAMSGSGAFTVVWSSDASTGTDDDLNSIQARRFRPNGMVVGTETQVNTYTPDGQYRPSIALGEKGFVVVWESYYSPLSSDDLDSVQARRFAVKEVLFSAFESGDFSDWSQVVQ